jgi:hypothetical protein
MLYIKKNVDFTLIMKVIKAYGGLSFYVVFLNK